MNTISIKNLASAGLTVLLLGLTLCGCSAKTEPDTLIRLTDPAVTETTAAPVAETRPATQPPVRETEQPTTEAETSPPLPVLSITTKRQDKHALDFAEKPVTPYIADEAARKLLDLRQYPAPFYEACLVTLTDTEGNVLPEEASADIRVRGNWTTYYDKKPLRIRFAEKQSMLALNGGESMKHWVLLAEYKDPSYLRNKTALAFAREILSPHGFYAADAQLVEVEINGEYWGVYLLTEQQEVNKHRIAVTKPDAEDPTAKIGYLLEYDGYSGHEDDLHQFTVSYADNAPLTPYDGNGGSVGVVYPLRKGWYDTKKNVGFSIKSDIQTQAQHDFIASYMDNVYRILYAAAYEQQAYRFNADFTAIEKADMTPREAVEAVIDVQSLADMYVLSELLCDADLNWSSFFMDVDFGEEGSKKLRFEAPWDFDSAMGLKDRCADGKGFYAANAVADLDNENYTINPWLAVLAYEDWFQDRVRDTWSRAYDDGVFDRVIGAIADDTETCADAFARDAARWEKKTDSFLKKEESAPTQQEAAESLASWLRSRADFLNRYWYQLPQETTEPASEETQEPSETTQTT